MKTPAELAALLDAHPWDRVDVHVHTHLCDGHASMTVKNIAARCAETGVALVALTPHFHKRVSDETETLYEDTREEILTALREEIDAYEAEDGRIHFLLSTEVDILSREGALSITPSPLLSQTLDFITPTMNYHPLLPLKAVHLTYGRDIDAIHASGEHARMAEAVGGIPCVLAAMYETEANAILAAPYPAMLGHFFAAHSIANEDYSWFGARPEHLAVMKEGAQRVLSACAQTGAMVDVTGIHLKDETPAHKREKDGFLHAYQTWFLQQCAEMGVKAYPGSDAHSLSGLGASRCYGELFAESISASRRGECEHTERK